MPQPSGFSVQELLKMRENTQQFINNAKILAGKSWIARDENLYEAEVAQRELNLINDELAKR